MANTDATQGSDGVFALFYDEEMQDPTPYHSGGGYVRRARYRMDRTFALIEPHVAGQVVLDVGASPFYLLYRAKRSSARRCHGVYFAQDDHPLRNAALVFSDAGCIEISHTNVTIDDLPFAENGVDILTACEILEHFDDFPAHLAEEIRRVLRPGGLMCLTVPNVCSIGNIKRLVLQRNIYMKYRSDSTGRHKHEYTMSQLRAFTRYLGMEVVDDGFMPSPTSAKHRYRLLYRGIGRVPGLRRYSPVLYMLARQPLLKPTTDLESFPPEIFDSARSVEA